MTLRFGFGNIFNEVIRAVDFLTDELYTWIVPVSQLGGTTMDNEDRKGRISAFVVCLFITALLIGGGAWFFFTPIVSKDGLLTSRSVLENEGVLAKGGLSQEALKKIQPQTPPLSEIYSIGDAFDLMVPTGVSAIYGGTSTGLPVLPSWSSGYKATMDASISGLSNGLVCQIINEGVAGIPSIIETQGIFSTGEILVKINCHIANDTSLIYTTASGLLSGTGKTTTRGSRNTFSVHEYSFSKKFEVFIWAPEGKRIVERITRAEGEIKKIDAYLSAMGNSNSLTPFQYFFSLPTRGRQERDSQFIVAIFALFGLGGLIVFLISGFVYSIKGNPNQAIDNCSKAIFLDPKNAVAYLNRGNAYYEKCDLEEVFTSVFLSEHQKTAYHNLSAAIYDYTRAIDLDPKYAAAYCNRGNAYRKIRKRDEALSDYTRAIELDPQYAVAYFHRGKFFNDESNLDQAIADYTKAITIDLQYAAAYYNRGNAHRDLGNLDQAIADYTKAIESDLQYAVAYSNRGNAHRDQGNLDQAIADYTKAIEIDPKYAIAYCRRGYAYSRKGNLDQAVADYTKAIRLARKYAAAYYNRGNAYREKGNLDEAIADYTKAIEIDPKSAVAYYNRGNAYREEVRLLLHTKGVLTPYVSCSTTSYTLKFHDIVHIVD
jgi:tetratricopeptide (TPR) repeat protein